MVLKYVATQASGNSKDILEKLFHGLVYSQIDIYKFLSSVNYYLILLTTLPY